MTIIYTAENNNHAAEILRAKVSKYEGVRKNNTVQYVNTVIGKMSSSVEDPVFAKRYGLASLSPDNENTIIVEAFNKILISKIDLPGFIRRIDIFEDKTDLKPFEESKLYGRNAVHLLLGLIAAERGCKTLSEARQYADIMTFARIAFIEEAGAGLIHKYHGMDELFSVSGFSKYAEDLLEKMTNS